MSEHELYIGAAELLPCKTPCPGRRPCCYWRNVEKCRDPWWH